MVWLAHEVKKMSTMAFSVWVFQKNTFHILIKGINLVNTGEREGRKGKSHCN